MIKIYKHQNEAITIIERLKKIMNFKIFPNKIINDNNWSFLFLESYSIFDIESFSLFSKLLKKIKCQHFYMCSAYSDDFDWNEYEVQFVEKKRTKITYCPIIKINSKIDYNVFEEKVDTKYGFLYIENYIFNDKLDFVIHYIPNKDIMIFFFKKKYDKTIKEIFSDISLKSVDELVEFSLDGFNENQLKKINDKWFSG